MICSGAAVPRCLDKVGRGRASRDAHRLVLGEDDRRVALLDEGLATGPRREAVEAALAGADWEACGRALAEVRGGGEATQLGNPILAASPL